MSSRNLTGQTTPAVSEHPDSLDMVLEPEDNERLLLAPGDGKTAGLRLDWQPRGAEQPGGVAVYRQVYALAARFDTTFPQAESSLIVDLWRDAATEDAVYNRMVVLSDTLPALVPVLGDAGPALQAVAEVDELIDAGASAVQVVPLFLAPGKHTRVDLPALMDAARARWPTIDFTVVPTLTESPAVREAIVTSALQAGSNR